MNKYRTCSYQGCDRKHEARGLCMSHNRQFREGEEAEAN